MIHTSQITAQNFLSLINQCIHQPWPAYSLSMLVFPTGDGASGGEGKGKKEKDGGTALFKSIAESLC